MVSTRTETAERKSSEFFVPLIESITAKKSIISMRGTFYDVAVCGAARGCIWIVFVVGDVVFEVLEEDGSFCISFVVFVSG